MKKEEREEKGIYRQYDSSAINLISAWPKVLKVLRGEVPDPEVVEIFPTNFCNFQCPHCRFKGYHGDSSTYMDIPSLVELLEELQRKDIKTIELSGGGEPLAHPQIEQFFDYLVRKNFCVGLITNGYHFIASKMLRKQARQCCNWIRFSVDGFTDKTYQRVHGRKDISYSKLKETISDFVKAGGEVPKIEMKMLISKINFQECDLAIKEALNLGVDCFQFKFLGHPQELVLEEEELLRKTEEIKELLRKAENTKVRAELVPPYRGPKTYTKCLMTFLHPVIDWDGEVYICAFFEHRKKKHSLGNIHKGGFFRHWDSPHHKKVFDSIDPTTCIPNCPMKRYNPVIDFIKSDWYRFPFV